MYTPEITLPFEYPAHNRQWIDIEGHKHKVKPIKVKKPKKLSRSKLIKKLESFDLYTLKNIFNYVMCL